MKKLVSLGVAIFKFKAFFDVCNFQLGYVSRITCSSEFRVPPTMSEFSNVMPILSMMLVFRMILKNVGVIEEPTPMVEISGVKKTVCATTPEDANSGRFKSIFKMTRLTKMTCFIRIRESEESLFICNQLLYIAKSKEYLLLLFYNNNKSFFSLLKIKFSIYYLISCQLGF